ncbi:MAG: thioesterase family protein [Bacteroidetes bacterium]|nr:thioesterase family protein [Bacteroidota bacterium]MBS1540636.1 thioesterase family protein [Bacteroidota bacterium]
MEHFALPIQIRWADIDQNRHLRHSAYYDYGALARITFFSQHGLTNPKLEEFQIGPILFREEALFKREIKFEDKISIDMQLVKSLPDFSRWSIRHTLKKEDGTLAAVLNLDGAWIDLVKRKLAIPNVTIQQMFSDFPQSSDFTWGDPLKK